MQDVYNTHFLIKCCVYFLSTHVEYWRCQNALIHISSVISHPKTSFHSPPPTSISTFVISPMPYRIPGVVHPYPPLRYTSYPLIPRSQSLSPLSSAITRHSRQPMSSPAPRPFQAPMKPTCVTRRSQTGGLPMKKLVKSKTGEV